MLPIFERIRIELDWRGVRTDLLTLGICEIPNNECSYSQLGRGTAVPLISDVCSICLGFRARKILSWAIMYGHNTECTYLLIAKNFSRCFITNIFLTSL